MLASKCHNTLLSFYRAQYSINFVSQLPFGWAMHFAKIVHSISNNQKGTKRKNVKKTSWICTKEKLSTSSEATSDQTD